jgi:hypothetical protein
MEESSWFYFLGQAVSAINNDIRPCGIASSITRQV